MSEARLRAHGPARRVATSAAGCAAPRTAVWAGRGISPVGGRACTGSGASKVWPYAAVVENDWRCRAWPPNGRMTPRGSIACVMGWPRDDGARLPWPRPRHPRMPHDSRRPSCAERRGDRGVGRRGCDARTAGAPHPRHQERVSESRLRRMGRRSRQRARASSRGNPSGTRPASASTAAYATNA